MRPQPTGSSATDLGTSERSVEAPWARQRLGGARRILDVGCSTSDYLADLACERPRQGRRVYGLDPDAPQPIRDVGVVKGTIVAPPFPAASFDLILCISTVEHIGLPIYGQHEFPHGDILALRHVRRLLAPGGRLLLTVPFGRAQVNPWFRVYDRWGLHRLTGGFRALSTAFYRLRPDGPSASSSPSPVAQATRLLRQRRIRLRRRREANPPPAEGRGPSTGSGHGSYEPCRAADLREAGYDFEHMRAEGVVLAELTPSGPLSFLLARAITRLSFWFDRLTGKEKPFLPPS
jgi:SAM-dependent methyltransferase